MTDKHTQKNDGPGRYANILLDYWFRRTFTSAKNSKQLLLLLLRQLIQDRKIKSIAYADTESVNPLPDHKGIRVDVECTDADGTRFVVEMQRAEQNWFYDRAVFNSTFAVQKQFRSGKRDPYELKPVYFIGILDFSLRKDDPRFLYRYMLRDTSDGSCMTESLQYIFLELPKCTDNPEGTVLERFGYAMRNLPRLEGIPEGFGEKIIRLLFESAEIVTFTPDERIKYDFDMTTERDIYNQIAFAREQGEKAGLKEGVAKGAQSKSVEIAAAMKAAGEPVEKIALFTGLSAEEIEKLG